MAFLSLLPLVTLTSAQSQYVESENYILVKEPKAWADAEIYCQDTFGTHLASVHNEEENTELKELCGATYSWFGFNDIDNEGTWVWSDGSLVDFKDWGPGNPNNARNNQHCGAPNYYGKWDDGYCTKSFAFACNRPSDQTQCDSFDIDRFLSDCSTEFGANEVDIASLKSDTSTLQTSLNEVEEKCDEMNGDLSEQIVDINSQIATKADAQSVSTLESQIASKADEESVNNKLASKVNVNDFDAFKSAVAQKTDVSSLEADVAGLKTRIEGIEEHLSHFVPRSSASAYQVGAMHMDGYEQLSPSQNLIIGALVAVNVATVIGCIACLAMQRMNNAKEQVVVYDDVQQQ